MKARRGHGRGRVSLDMISNLPQNIIETILCFLPIQDAARTNVLSKEWRYKWTKIPKLVFDENTFKASNDRELDALQAKTDKQIRGRGMTKTCKLFSAIYQVLLVHQGPIHEFSIIVNADTLCFEIDQIILHLLWNNNVRKFTLELLEFDEYWLPFSVFSLRQLTDLYLRNCSIYHIPTINVICSLTSLYMETVKIDMNTLLHLLSNSPLLKSFTLIMSEEVDIDNDNSTLTQLFECLPVIEYLYISLDYIEHLCFQDGVTVTQEHLPSLVYLKYLRIYPMFCDHDELPFLRLLIRSSPNLEKLKLRFRISSGYKESELESLTLEEYSDIRLEHLNELEIDGFSNLKPHVEFLKLILAKSPVLKKVGIVLNDVSKHEELKILRILLRCPRASPVVDIVVDPLFI